MYLDYFQLQAEPFNIAPNPKYLYPSQRHQEAIKYLRYGLSGAGGFVMLTGEVGTGKTMVSRTVLSQLPEHIQVAYVLNPTLDSLQLLQAVCESFNIEMPPEIDHKVLSDLLQHFLIEQHHQQKACLLVIDEAQHLSAEALEQLRLFTNIETDEKKLLQIILIGQPELQEKLQHHQLRQLAQRITARYHLLPLTQQETFAYIEHRVKAAGSERVLFTKNALKRIYKLTQGTPRLINLLCDRALATCFYASQLQVNDKVVAKASHDVIGLNKVKAESSSGSSAASMLISFNGLLIVVVIILMLAVGWLSGYIFGNQPEPLLSSVNRENKQVNTESEDSKQMTPKVSETTEHELIKPEPLPVIESHKNTKTDEDITKEAISIKTALDEKGNLVTQVEQRNTSTTEVVTEVAGELKPIERSSVETLDLDDIPDEIKQAFDTAVQQTHTEVNTNVVERPLKVDSSLPSIFELSQAQQLQIPSMVYQTHIYSSQPSECWVKINNQILYEGDAISASMVVKEIRQDTLIWQSDFGRFIQEALVDYP